MSNKEPRRFWYGETPFNSEKIYANDNPEWGLGDILTHAIKLECGIPNASKEEANRAITYFLADCLVKYIQDEVAAWKKLPTETFNYHSVFASNAMLDIIDRVFNDEHFDNMNDLMNKHRDELVNEFGIEAFEKYWGTK